MIMELLHIYFLHFLLFLLVFLHMGFKLYILLGVFKHMHFCIYLQYLQGITEEPLFLHCNAHASTEGIVGHPFKTSALVPLPTSSRGSMLMMCIWVSKASTDLLPPFFLNIQINKTQQSYIPMEPPCQQSRCLHNLSRMSLTVSLRVDCYFLQPEYSIFWFVSIHSCW